MLYGRKVSRHSLRHTFVSFAFALIISGFLTPIFARGEALDCQEGLVAIAEEESAVTQKGISEESLWENFKKSGSLSARNELMLRYLERVKTIAQSLAKRLPNDHLNYAEDMNQAGVFGLRDAINSFDPSRGVPFKNYMPTRVRGAMLDYLRSLDHLPRLVHSAKKRLQESIDQFRSEHGRDPRANELPQFKDSENPEKAKFDLELIPELRRIESMTNENRRQHSREGESFAEAIVQSKEQGRFTEAERNDLKEFLINGLTKQQRAVILLYYWEGLSLKEIGQAMDLCESRASQIRNEAMQRLREKMGRRNADLLED